MSRNSPFLGTSERPNGVEVWDNKSGPEGASTPESPGLTCITRSSRGASCA